MDRIQYVVGEVDGQWFVQVHDQLYGPYQSQALAIKDAVKASRMSPRRGHLIGRCVDRCRTAFGTSKFYANFSERRARHWTRAKSLIIASFCVASIATFATSAIRVHARPIPVTVNDMWKPEVANVQSIDQAMLLMPDYISRQREPKKSESRPEQTSLSAIDSFTATLYCRQAKIGLLWFPATSGLICACRSGRTTS